MQMTYNYLLREELIQGHITVVFSNILDPIISFTSNNNNNSLLDHSPYKKIVVIYLYLKKKITGHLHV